MHLLGLRLQPQACEAPDTSPHVVLSSSLCISKIQPNPIVADPSHRCTNRIAFSTFGTSASRQFAPNDSLAWRCRSRCTILTTYREMPRPTPRRSPIRLARFHCILSTSVGHACQAFHHCACIIKPASHPLLPREPRKIIRHEMALWIANRGTRNRLKDA